MNDRPLLSGFLEHCSRNSETPAVNYYIALLLLLSLSKAIAIDPWSCKLMDSSMIEEEVRHVKETIPELDQSRWGHLADINKTYDRLEACKANFGSSCIDLISGFQTPLDPRLQALSSYENPQLALWRMDPQQRLVFQEKIKKAIEKIDSFEDIYVPPAKDQGSFPVFMGKIKGNWDVVLKSDRAGAAREIAASRIAEKLELGLVPFTESTKIKGQRFAAQTMVRDAVPSSAISVPGKERMDQLERLEFFDYIIANYDRVPENILYAGKNKEMVIGIDNGNSFRKIFPKALEKQKSKALNYLKNGKGGPEMQKRIDDLSFDDLKGAVGNTLTEKQLIETWERVKSLQTPPTLMEKFRGIFGKKK